MKARILTLILGAVLVAASLAGCNKTDGATVAEGTPTPPAAGSNFTPGDPAAKAATEEKAKTEETKITDAQTTTAVKNSQAEEAAKPGATAGKDVTMPKPGDKVAVIDTNLGRIVFKFRADKSPKTVANFVKLVGQKFYDGTKFHRVIPDFMIQGGDPNTKGSDRNSYGMGGPGYTIDDEFNDLSHTRGAVSMAHTQAPNSAGSQFFICVGNPTFLDGKYAIFGQVVQGMDVADKIVALPRDQRDDPTPDEAVMSKVRIETWPLK